eukprot:6490322-Amphidinium_carterae.2
MLRELLSVHKLVFLQETHDFCGLEDFAGERFWISWSRHPSSPRAGGVVIFVHKSIAPEAPEFVEIVAGRALATHFCIGTFPVCFINCHITPDEALHLSWVQMAEAIRDYVHTIAHGLVCLIGDMNFADMPGDVVSFTGNEVGFSAARASCWERCFPEFSQISSSWTLRHKATSTLRRNDRCYLRLSPLLLHVSGMCTHVLGSSILPPAGSDHWPLCISWTPSGTGHDGPLLSRAACTHPDWHRCFRHHLLDFDLINGDFSVRWGRVMAAARCAVSMLHRSSGPVVLGSHRSQYEFALKCLRQLVEGRIQCVKTSLQRSIWHSLALHDEAGLLLALERKAHLAWESLLQEEIELNASEDGDKNTSSFLVRLLAMWKKRKVGSTLPCITTDNDAHHTVLDELVSLKTYWSSIFAKDFAPCPDATRTLTPWIQSLGWPAACISVEDICDCISTLPDTAGGPDGLCYRMLRKVGPLIAPILMDAASFIVAGGRFPSSWNDAYLVFIPKSTATHVGPEGVRPLCLANVARKILCKIWAFKLRGLLLALHPSQVGFMPGRHACEALARLERFMFTEAASNPHCALFFSDLRQAFASMSRRWIFHVLEFASAPVAWTHIFSAVLDESCLFLLWKGVMHEVIWMRSGVGQGDPLSPFLFVLSLDPFIRWMHASRDPPSIGAALADDMCWLVQCLADLIRKSFEYRILYLATGLPLNYGKCAILPCGSVGVNGWATLLRDAVPPQHPLLLISIVSELRYLGFWLSRGPIAALDTLATQKAIASAGIIRAMHLGVARNVQIGHVVLEGMLRFPLMASAVTDHTRQAWRQIEQVLSLSSLNLHDVKYRVKELFQWPRNGTSLEHLALVAKLPLLLGPAVHCSTVWQDILTGCQSDLLNHPMAGWMASGCWNSWHRARVELLRLGIMRDDGGLRMSRGDASAAIRVACIPSLPQTMQTWTRLLHRKWAIHLPRTRHGALFLDRACSSVQFVAKFHCPSASAALVRLLLGPFEVHRLHCHMGNCCFCTDFHIASSWAHRLLCGCFRTALRHISQFSWLTSADADVFLHLVICARNKVDAYRLGSLALVLCEAINCCQHEALTMDSVDRPFLQHCAHRALRRHAARRHGIASSPGRHT